MTRVSYVVTVGLASLVSLAAAIAAAGRRVAAAGRLVTSIIASTLAAASASSRISGGVGVRSWRRLDRARGAGVGCDLGGRG